MTREEAISTLESESCYECSWGCESPVKCDCPKCNLKSAVNMGIEALKETERNPTITSWHDFDRGYNIAKEKFNRPHGEWVDVPKYKGFYVCSNCLKKLDGDFERFDHWEMKKENFCPVCGSDNRGASE